MSVNAFKKKKNDKLSEIFTVQEKVQFMFVQSSYVSQLSSEHEVTNIWVKNGFHMTAMIPADKVQ